MVNKKALFFLAIVPSLLSGCAMMQEEPPKMAERPPVVQPPPRQVNGAIFQTGRDVRLFENRTAHRPGDVLTIVLEEKTDASKAADSSYGKKDAVGLGTPTAFGKGLKLFNYPMQASISADRNFGGGGKMDQSNALSGTVTAVVLDVYPNGNMVVQGRKRITLNRGDEYVTITGVVRPDDNVPDNTVYSTCVAVCPDRLYRHRGAGGSQFPGLAYAAVYERDMAILGARG